MEHRCNVCLNQILYPELIGTNCHHIFHIECLKKWLNKNNSCPTCRQVKPLTNFVPEKKCFCAKDFEYEYITGTLDLEEIISSSSQSLLLNIWNESRIEQVIGRVPRFHSND